MDKPVVMVAALSNADQARSHRMVTKFEVLGLDNEVLAELTTVTEGSITYDAGAGARSRLDLTVVDDGSGIWIPRSPASLLTPFGNEIRVARGIEYGDRVELRQMGIFVIETASTTDSPEGVLVSVSGPDRSGDLTDSAFERAFDVPRTTQASAAILAAVREVMPNVPTDFEPTDVPLAHYVAQEGDDRWEFCQAIALSIGGQLYFGDEGELILRQIVFPSGTPLHTIAEGPGGVMLGAAREWDRAPVYNKIIVSAENEAGETFRAEAFDDNPLSPTYYFGNFGRKPFFWSNSKIDTKTECENSAAGLLAQTIGAPDTISFESLVNVNFRPNTLIRIEREKLGVAEDHVLDSVTIPLTSEGQMSGRTRAVALPIE